MVLNIGMSHDPATDEWVVLTKEDWREVVIAHDAFEAARWWLRCEAGDVSADSFTRVEPDASRAARDTAFRRYVAQYSVTSAKIDAARWRVDAEGARLAAVRTKLVTALARRAGGRS